MKDTRAKSNEGHKQEPPRKRKGSQVLASNPWLHFLHFLHVRIFSSHSLASKSATQEVLRYKALLGQETLASLGKRGMGF